jgi:sugar lactone lactonase YvrE
MSIRRLTLAGLATLCVSGGGLALSSVPALAGTGYRYSHSFGEFGSGEGQFSEPNAVAVNDFTEEVYVVDRGNNRVERFGTDGKYLGQFNGSEAPSGEFVSPGGIAVDNSCQLQHKSGSECESFDPSNGDVYVVDTEHKVIDKFTPTGTYIDQLAETSSGEPFGELLGGVAVDANGSAWVYQSGTGEIDHYSDALANAFVSKVTSGEPPGFGGFSVDSHDDLYVKTGRERIAKLTSGAEPLIQELDSNTARGVAVDLSSNEVLVDNGEELAAFSESGSPIARFQRGGERNGGALGIDSASGMLYVAEPFANEIDIFSPHPTPPPPNTDPVSAVTPTSATLNGDLNPEGVTGGVGFYFSYNVGSSCFGPGSHTTPSGNAAGASDVPESVSVTGLQPNAPYAYCFFATNEFGATSGLIATFATPPAKPSVDREAASGVTLTDATLEAEINPNNQETTYQFEYGPTTSYGHTAPASPQSIGLEYGDKSGSAEIGGGLTSAETYHYRVVAVNATGMTEGPDQTFTTLPFPPTVTLGEATAGTDAATVSFATNARGGDTQYAVRYGTSTAYTAQVRGDAGRSRIAVPITVTLPELAPGTIYHYSVNVQNAGGEEATSDQTFTTSGAPSTPAEERVIPEEPIGTVPLVLAQPPTPPLLSIAPIVFPAETGTTPSTSKPLTRAHKLAKALRACKKQPRRKRAACKRRAHKQYGTSRKT